MLLKLVFVMMVGAEAACGIDPDELLNGFAGERGGNRMSLCMQRDHVLPPRCSGVLLRKHWMLTRASCVINRPLFVIRHTKGVNCDDLHKDKELTQALNVYAKFVHPNYGRSPSGDLALVAVDQHIQPLERLANITSVNSLLGEILPWMEEVSKLYPTAMMHQPLPGVILHRPSYKHNSTLFLTPLRMILTTIIVPMVSFMLVFVYVIFYTGAKDQIPYKSIENEESEKHIENEESEKNIQYDENEKSIQNEKSEIGDSRLRNVET